MDLTRAKEILSSPETIQVRYQGSPVWIESIREGSGTAEVTVLDKQEKIHVPVAQLAE
ncbi:MAG: Small, acid-soluble spore protein H [Candidatus Dichloromethanomonas elyunquensis]|nr:MAG: Small, acid-soluble spore protein H [Candidatus Dichloromethanomonas elyunquensis]